MGVPQHVRVDRDARHPAVVLEHLLDGGGRQGGSDGGDAVPCPGVFARDDPQVRGPRRDPHPDLAQVDVEQAQDIRRKMDETIAPIAGLGPRAILVGGAEAHLHPAPPDVQVVHMQPA